MKKLFVSTILLLFLLVPRVSIARTDVFLNFGIGIPVPFFVAPAPVVVYPPSVVVQPAPVIVGPPGWYVGNHRGWYKHHKHFKEDD
jgi:hypothetical protein